MDKAKENEESKTGRFELVDCGRASEKTRGLPLVAFFEFGPAPWNKLFLL